MISKPIVQCADRLGGLWSKGVRNSAIIVVPLLLTSKLFGAYEWISIGLCFVIVIFGLLKSLSASRHDNCPVCGAEGEIVMGRKVKFSCPVCQETFDTDCEVLYAGAKPSKIP